VVSPEEENEGYGGKDLQKRKILSLEWNTLHVAFSQNKHSAT